MRLASHYIDGRWLDGIGEHRLFGESINPPTSEPCALFANGGVAEASAALDAAWKAFHHTPWRRSPRLRAAILLDFASRLEARRDEIADWLVTLNGKLRSEALGEIAAGVIGYFLVIGSWFGWFA